VSEPTAREQLLDAAERLIAERGVMAPLQDVALAAGQRNKSAVQYYFGDRDGLIAAILDHRVRPQEADRLRRLADLESADAGNDPGRLISALIEPTFTIPRMHGATHHARFLEQIRAHPALVALGTTGGTTAVRMILARLERALQPMPPELRRRRLWALTTAQFALLADHERALESGTATDAETPEALADIAAVLQGLLLAPAPAAAQRS
jgi:AcrR family transcriptional regulator